MFSLPAILIVIMSLGVVSCSQKRLTEEEAIIVEKYTKDKKHDVDLVGEWINNDSWEHKGTTNRDDISFDVQGIKKERMYKDGEPFNDWHFVYYYYSENDTIFLYRPAEKGFMAMDGELFLTTQYKVSEDGETLYLGDKSYKKRK